VSKPEAVTQRIRERKQRRIGRQDIGMRNFVPDSMLQQSVIRAGGKNFGGKG
jgi:hypothetical protein